MILTPDQLDEILKVVSYHQVEFIAENVGTSVLTSSDIDLLKEFGVDITELPVEGTVDDAFKFGILSTALNEAKLKKLSYVQFKKFLQEGKGIPLSAEERFALRNVKTRAYSDIKGLGNRIYDNFQSIAIEESKNQRKKYEKIIKETAQTNIITRGSISNLVSELGHKTNDWSRDFGRISDFIMHEAFDHGRAEGMKREFGDDQDVYKEVYPGACKHCIRLYLTKGQGSKPKIFKLSVLEGNGTNVGRKVDDWKPVIGSTHPWCRCTLRRKPQGYEWSDKTQSFSQPTGERKVERKSKIKVNIAGKESLV